MFLVVLQQNNICSA